MSCSKIWKNKTKQKHDLNEGQLIYITLQWPVEDSRSTEDRRTEENLKKNTEWKKIHFKSASAATWGKSPIMPNSEETQPLLRSTDPGICDTTNQGLKWRRNFQNFNCLCSSFFTETGTVTSSNGSAANATPFSPRRGSSSESVPPGGLVVTSVDEVPPPSYTTVTGGTPVVTCRVCQVSFSKILHTWYTYLSLQLLA